MHLVAAPAADASHAHHGHANYAADHTPLLLRRRLFLFRLMDTASIAKLGHLSEQVLQRMLLDVVREIPAVRHVTTVQHASLLILLGMMLFGTICQRHA